MKIFSQELITLVCIGCSTLPSYSQAVDSIPMKGFSIELQAGYAGNNAVPFWMQSNLHGSKPVAGINAGLIAQAFREYQYPSSKLEQLPPKVKSWDWAYNLEARVNTGSRTEVKLIEAVAKLRYKIVEVKAGRSKDIMGLNGDSLLSSGNFAISGNALGIPKLGISIPEFYRIPWFDGLFSVKGNFAAGYTGKSPINPEVFMQEPLDDEVQTLFHQKSLYGRLGKENWNIQLYAGLNHQVQWGGEKKVYGENYKLNTIQTLWYAIWGLAYGEGGTGIPKSKIGNHLGSIDIAMAYNFQNIQLLAYRQNFYEVGAISKLANIKDGLTGIAITNKKYNAAGQSFDWERFLGEFFYSKDQAGYPWSKPTKSGDEDYYNNYFYSNGWSYKQRGIGSPLIIPARDAAKGQAHYPADFFISNRVVAGHLGAKVRISSWKLLTKVTYARHYGTFATSEYGKSTGALWHPAHEEKFVPASQFSSYIKAERKIYSKTTVGGAFALDMGGMLPSNTGAMVHFKQQF